MIIQLTQMVAEVCQKYLQHISDGLSTLEFADRIGLIQLLIIQAVEYTIYLFTGFGQFLSELFTAQVFGTEFPFTVSYIAAVTKCMTNKMEQIACQVQDQVTPAVERAWRKCPEAGVRRILFQFLEAFIDLCEIDLSED